MTKTPYTLTVSDTVTIFSRKDRAVAAGEATGEGFTVTNPKGVLVHEVEADEVELDEVELDEVEEIGATIIGLPTVAAPKKVCKNGADHEFRVTKSGNYCYTCDRVIAEAQKAARAAAKSE